MEGNRLEMVLEAPRRVLFGVTSMSGSSPVPENITLPRVTLPEMFRAYALYLMYSALHES